MLVSEQKEKLRKKLIKQRSELDDSIWKSKSMQVLENLKQTKAYKSSNVIHSFISMNSRNEVDNHDFIKNELAKKKRILVSISNFENSTLKHVELKNFDDLKPNKWGVLEPNYHTETNIQPDIILVPLLAADNNYNRLGYGKGFYDRFLADTNAVKIGLLFERFVLPEIPTTKLDEKLDMLITEENIYTRNN